MAASAMPWTPARTTKGDLLRGVREGRSPRDQWLSGSAGADRTGGYAGADLFLGDPTGIDDLGHVVLGDRRRVEGDGVDRVATRRRELHGRCLGRLGAVRQAVGHRHGVASGTTTELDGRAAGN